jgi:hypothetical protein
MGKWPAGAAGTRGRYAISTSSASYGSLEIYVTELNITSPLGIHTFLSSFTEDLFNGRI